MPIPLRSASLRRAARAVLAASLLGAALAAVAAPLAAQGGVGLPRPHLEWRTTESQWFVFHYPAEMRDWTLDVAPRMDAIRDQVRALVGYAPDAKTHVVVEDPFNQPNGSAWPIVRAPVIYLWPVPPEPTSAIGNNRTWGEILGVHEFGHIAHMTRPSRRPLYRIRSPFGWLGLSPVTVKAPRWAFEGYATFIEGRLTGSGRPHGVWRPAILRQWAREGRLPTYAGLNGMDGFYQGSLAYLVGSAYLEWLAEQKGDSSLVHVWRRLTARQPRSFDAAFTGVYGAPPAQLYGRFVAELTAKAMEAEERIGVEDTAAAGVTVQRHGWFAGDPAVSPDGKLIAIRLSDRRFPGKIVLWKTQPDTMTAKERERRRRMLARDPEDVAAVEIPPRPRKPVATLWARGSGGFDDPRWFADNERLLVTHSEGRPDGVLRPDLWIWNSKSKRLTRVTHGAAVRTADPAPDGRRAVGTRCLNGDCDLVTVDLITGRVARLVAGTATVSWYRPRWSPDGRSVVAAVQRAGIWRLALVDAATGAVTPVGPQRDLVNRYDATFTRDGRALVAIGEENGIPNVERIELATGATRPLTRVQGAATAPEPEPNGSGVYFLSLYPRGMDLKRVAADSVRLADGARLDTTLSPAASVGITRADTFRTDRLAPEHGYGLGPRRHLLLPFAVGAVEGRLYGLTLSSVDPVGRFAWTLTGGGARDRDAASGRGGALLDAEGMWRGGALRAEWRGFRPKLEGELFYLEHRPGRQHVQGFAAPAGLDVDYPGARLGVTLARDLAWRAHEYRAGASMGRLDPLGPGAGDAEDRRLAYASFASAYRFLTKKGWLGARVALHGATGRTVEQDWSRWTGALGLSAGGPDGGLRVDAMYGETAGDAVGFEQFVVGGVRQPFVDPVLLSQRIPMPALPVGLLGGREIATYRVAIDGAGFQPFLWGANTGERFGELSLKNFYNVAGVQLSESTPNIPFVRLPGVRLDAGLAYTLDEPLEKRWRGWAGVTYQP